MTSKTPETPETSGGAGGAGGVGPGGTAPRPGRPVVLEATAPGLWQTLIGAMIAALAPMFGFLIGSSMGLGDGDGLSPLHLGLFLGVIVGGCGAVLALLGVRRLYLSHRANL